VKNQLGKAAVQHIARCLRELMPAFEPEPFCAAALEGLEQYELKQRVMHIIHALHACLPNDFEQTAKVLHGLPDVWSVQGSDTELSAFAAWPLIDYASVYGLAQPNTALALLKKLTPLFSAEFAIRPFILEHLDYCMQQFTQWVHDDDEHVRRLVSEGTRPRLPWGMQLKGFIQDPRPVLPLLAALRDDMSLYVRRSVANHLNDISKDNPELLIATCRDWQHDASAQTHWIIKHATRSLVKAGHPEVLQLLGYQSHLALQAVQLHITATQLQLGEYLEFSCSIASTSTQNQQLVIDFAIHFMKGNGQQKAKVFKLKTFNLAAQQQLTIQKRHAIKAITTRQYYPGAHKLEILVNGQSMASENFELSMPS
jgi:3-methyladenine DNA glycosylase AlkC